MFKLNEDYYIRKCFLEKNEVPTQSNMKKTMGDALAKVYFNDMNYKLKALAGLAPPMKGGGNDWCVPPDDILNGKCSLKPMKNEVLNKLSYLGIDAVSKDLLDKLKTTKVQEIKNAVLGNDKQWKEELKNKGTKLYQDTAKRETQKNSLVISDTFHEFKTLYTTALSKLETLLFDASVKAIEDVKKDTFNKMKLEYKCLLKKQATQQYDKYINHLNKEIEAQKTKFINDIEENRKNTMKIIHDVNLEKHKTIEKLRSFLEYQSLACQMYVAMTEKGEYDKEVNEMRIDYSDKIHSLEKDIEQTEDEIFFAEERQRNRQIIDNIWKTKLCHFVKKFQKFVTYSLKLLPEYANFFINIEKLMLLQVNHMIYNPSCESIIEEETTILSTSDSTLTPFVIYGDCKKDYIEGDPSSIPTDIPLFMINKHYIYASCHNLQDLALKLDNVLKSPDPRIKDDYDYSYSMPVKVTSSQDIKELKLESSLMQVLQNNIPNLNNISTECDCICKVKYCFCATPHVSKDTSIEDLKQPSQNVLDVPDYKKINSRIEELRHERNPNVKDYIDYVTPRKCKCRLRAKKFLNDHLPPYMVSVSPFTSPVIPNYELCSVRELKTLVMKSHHIPPKITKEPELKFKDVGTQYSDEEFEAICNCFADDEIANCYKEVVNVRNVSGEKPENKELQNVRSASNTQIDKPESFALERAFELRNLIDSFPDIQDIFVKSDCNFK